MPPHAVYYTSAADEVRNEVQVLRLLHHPFIAELKEIIEDEEEEKIYLCKLDLMQSWSTAPAEKSQPGRLRPKNSPSTSISPLYRLSNGHSRSWPLQ
jgi:hypothetical protein